MESGRLISATLWTWKFGKRRTTHHSESQNLVSKNLKIDIDWTKIPKIDKKA